MLGNVQYQGNDFIDYSERDCERQGLICNPMGVEFEIG